MDRFSNYELFLFYIRKIEGYRWSSRMYEDESLLSTAKFFPRLNFSLVSRAMAVRPRSIKKLDESWINSSDKRSPLCQASFFIPAGPLRRDDKTCLSRVLELLARANRTGCRWNSGQLAAVLIFPWTCYYRSHGNLSNHDFPWRMCGSRRKGLKDLRLRWPFVVWIFQWFS